MLNSLVIYTLLPIELVRKKNITKWEREREREREWKSNLLLDLISLCSPNRCRPFEMSPRAAEKERKTKNGQARKRQVTKWQNRSHIRKNLHYTQNRKIQKNIPLNEQAQKNDLPIGNSLQLTN
jgi:hypothetical protein